MKTYSKTVLVIITVFVVYTLLFSGYIYYSFSNFAFTDFYKRLELRVSTTAVMQLGDAQESVNVEEVYKDYLEKLPHQKEYIIPLTKAGKDTVRTKGIPKQLLQDALNNGKANFNQGKLFYSALLYKDKQQQEYMVVVSAENYFYNHHITYLRNLLITSLAFSVLLIVIVSHFVFRTLIRPVRNIINEVNKISSENLHLRLVSPTTNNGDPISELTNTFNDMLNRLETSFETQKNFISNASHELNTPLTSIMAEAELALSKKRTSEEYETALAKILEEADKLEQKTKALLYLARTGFDGKSQKFSKVRVDEILLEVKDNLQSVNSNFKIKMDFSLLPENPEKLKIKGNGPLLHLAISNIVSNACKYSNHQQVYLALGASDNSVVIIIKDHGIGIPEREIQYIYDPYFRASNTSNYEGYGIGLPLSRNIILMHKGELIVRSIEGVGTTVQINLPIGDYKL